MTLTELFALILRSRLAAARRWSDGALIEQTQRHELNRLVRMARDTEWGRAHNFRRVRSYEDYIQAIPAPVDYASLRPWVMRMIAGERNLLWPGLTRSFAQSSGTSEGRSKYIPVTDEGLRRCHYRGTRHSVAHYLDNVSGSHLFEGKAFILGGSFHTEAQPAPGLKVGDLSASLISRMPGLSSLLRVPSLKIALMEDWRLKLPALVAASCRDRRITNISGVPSWFLGVLNEVLAATGASSIHDVWPKLEVFFHGGIAFGPYRDQYRRITDPTKMHFIENYNASEGFFAVQNDLADPAMLLLLDAGTFFEFAPVDHHGPILPAWQVVKGEVYELVISNVNGLWRYPLGDTVKIESLSPLKITVAGRTRSFINAFGEEVMVYNADAAIAKACQATGATVSDYTAAPVYAADGRRGCHQWLIDFARAPQSLPEFVKTLDSALQQENSDYQAKRAGSIFLDPPIVTPAPHGLFNLWLEQRGQLGGQHKVPRLANDRSIINPLLELANSLSVNQK